MHLNVKLTVINREYSYVNIWIIKRRLFRQTFISHKNFNKYLMRRFPPPVV